MSSDAIPLDDLDAVKRLGETLGHEFRDAGCALTALSHSSYAQEKHGDRGNERLEFLGDAVLDHVVSELLYVSHPEWNEGKLTRARASLVKGEALADRARRMGLPALVRLGRTELSSGGAEKNSILAGALEAVIGALYLDGGLDAVRAVVEEWFADGITETTRDAKTAFQEWAHATLGETPSYHTLDDSGIEDDDDRFTVEVRVVGEAWGRGIGRTKRLAERAAAKSALARVEAGE